MNPCKNRYVLSKHLAEQACGFYSRWMPIVNVRLSNIYGPTRRPLWDLIHGPCRKLLEQGRACMWSTLAERDFLYVEDAAEAIVKLLEADFAGTVNLGSGTMTSAGRIRQMLEQASGGVIEVLDQRVEGSARFQCDITRLRDLTGWTPRCSIEEGVRRTFEIMKSWSRA